MQCVLYFDVQGTSQFIGKIPARGMIDECFGGCQQCAEAREPDGCLRPQSVIVETSNLTEGVVPATMGVAGEIIQRFEFAEDSDIDRGAEGLLKFIQGGDLVAQEQRSQLIGAKRKGPHNVIVPTITISPVRYYNKTQALGHCLQKPPEPCYFAT